MFKARAKKTKYGYIGIVTFFANDNKPLYEYITKIERLTKKDAVSDAKTEIEYAKEQALIPDNLFWVTCNNRPKASFATKAEAESHIEKQKQGLIMQNYIIPNYAITYNGKQV